MQQAAEHATGVVRMASPSPGPAWDLHAAQGELRSVDFRRAPVLANELVTFQEQVVRALTDLITRTEPFIKGGVRGRP